jgi:hypothetical protein
VNKELLMENIRQQSRNLRSLHVPPITDGINASGAEVPIEARYVLAIHPDDELDVRSLDSFMSCANYRNQHLQTFMVDELGALEGYGIRIVLDSAQRIEEPRLYGQGQRVVRMLPRQEHVA